MKYSNIVISPVTQQPGFARGFINKLHVLLSAPVWAGVALAGSVLCSAATATAGQPPQVPSPECDEINPPEGARLTARFYATGVQIYQWNGSAWTFIAPDATLSADPCYSSVVGFHFAGPTWQAADGSEVVAFRLELCTPVRGALPWLLLGVPSAPEHGRFAGVTHIQRVNTVGGNAPAEAGLFVGDEARVPYTAEYYFYRWSGVIEQSRMSR